MSNPTIGKSHEELLAELYELKKEEEKYWTEQLIKQKEEIKRFNKLQGYSKRNISPKEYQCSYIDYKCECGVDSAMSNEPHSSWCPVHEKEEIVV